MKRLIPALILGACSFCTQAANVQISTTDPANGITDIYSATFDPPLNPVCTGAPDPAECAFFGGQPPASRAITLVPNPTGVDNGVPAGIVPTPAAGSFLDVDLVAGNTQVTLNGGVIYISGFEIVISDGTANQTNVITTDVGFELKNFSPVTVSVDDDGVGIFEVDLSPVIAADFSAFTDIVDLPDDCTGSLCPLIPILTLDMNRFRLVLDYNAGFTAFAGDFVGQTASNSMVYATLNSVPVPATFWLFGSALGLLGWMKRRFA
ncbi:MAG: hypothetical protein ACN4GT_14710 [Gammaproteobacteria bacterium]